jgi:hypothetical protein
MRLIKHHKEPIVFDPDFVYPRRKTETYFKPRGLWVSDEDAYGWSHWCQAEDFRTDDLMYEHLVELWPENNVLFISNVEELDRFHEEHSIDILGSTRPFPLEERKDWLNWTEIYPLYQGIIITPYLWERRMDYMWYYGWDCAGGCIWDLGAIRTFRPLFKLLYENTTEVHGR